MDLDIQSWEDKENMHGFDKVDMRNNMKGRAVPEKCQEESKKPAIIVLILFAVAIYASAGYFSKSASFYTFLSLPYLAYFSGVILILAIYAVLWQMILKRVPLSVAYPFRSLGVVYGLAIAGFAFREPITWQNMLGGAIVMFGLFVMTTGK